MSDETAAVLAISAAVALYALGMGAIAFALFKVKPRWWVSYLAYAGFSVLCGNACNYLMDPSRYSEANALNSLAGCSTASAGAVAAVWLSFKRARGRIDDAFNRADQPRS